MRAELWGRDLHGRTDSPRPAAFLLSAEELVRLAEPVLEAVLGPPAELVHCEARIEDAPLELAGAGRHELRVELRPRDSLAQLEQLDDRRLAPGADVVEAAVVGRRRDVARATSPT